MITIEVKSDAARVVEYPSWGVAHMALWRLQDGHRQCARFASVIDGTRRTLEVTPDRVGYHDDTGLFRSLCNR